MGIIIYGDPSGNKFIFHFLAETFCLKSQFKCLFKRFIVDVNNLQTKGYTRLERTNVTRSMSYLKWSVTLGSVTCWPRCMTHVILWYGSTVQCSTVVLNTLPTTIRLNPRCSSPEEEFKEKLQTIWLEEYNRIAINWCF